MNEPEYLCKTLKALKINAFFFDGLITPTLEVVGSNPVSRTKNPHPRCGWGFLLLGSGFEVYALYG